MTRSVDLDRGSVRVLHTDPAIDPLHRDVVGFESRGEGPGNRCLESQDQPRNGVSALQDHGQPAYT